MQIAIDGTAGSGKSSAARGLAAELGLRYIDSGAYYRAVGVIADRLTIDLTSDQAISNFLDSLSLDISNGEKGQQVICNGQDLSAAIRTDEGSEAASTVARIPAVREFVTGLLRKNAAGGCVMEGRDIGTVVLPEADYKFFLTASPEVRAQRRAGDKNYQRSSDDLSAIRQSLEKRDSADSTRQTAPLKPAGDAIVIDSSHMTLEEVVRALADHTTGRE